MVFKYLYNVINDRFDKNKFYDYKLLTDLSLYLIANLENELISKKLVLPVWLTSCPKPESSKVN